jgi:hypothetical protein
MMGAELWLVATGGVVFWICVIGTAIAAVLVASSLFYDLADKRGKNGLARAVGKYTPTRLTPAIHKRPLGSTVETPDTCPSPTSERVGPASAQLAQVQQP